MVEIQSCLYIFIFSSLLSCIYAQNNTQSDGIGKRFRLCDDHSHCNNNGFCYQDSATATNKFCSCNHEFYGFKCDKNAGKTMDDKIIYGLTSLCVLLVIALLITIYLLCRKTRKEIDDASIQKENFNGMLTTKPASPMYSHHTFLELDRKTSVASSNGNLPNENVQNGHAFDIKDGGLTENTSNTFQAPDLNDDKDSIKKEEDEEKIEEKDVIVNIEVEGKDVQTTPPPKNLHVDSTIKVTPNEKPRRNDYEQDSISAYSMSESAHNLIPPNYPRRPTSQDGSDSEQNMDAIYRDYYAKRAAFTAPRTQLRYEPELVVRDRRIPRSPDAYERSLSPIHNRVPTSPNDRRISVSPSERSIPISPTRQARHRPMSPGYDVQLHPVHAARGYATNPRNQNRHHMVQHQRRDVRGRKMSDFTDANGRVRSMGDLSYLGMEPDYRRRARSVDDLDNISYVSSVENIHTGRVTRVSPKAAMQARSPRGRGIWARSGEN